MGTGTPLILVVEDDPDNLESLVELIREEGYDVLPARSGQEASDQVARARPGLMILDYLLPDTTGTELAVRLRQQLADPPVPIVYLTATVDPIDALDAQVVKKPVTLKDLLAVLERYCGPHPSAA
jgi:two-component system, chemotaxis family, chemotaxis protein CheY